jgi:hypothetical protein
MVVDEESPAGAWAEELKRMPWGYGQQREPSLEEIYAKLRRGGFSREVDLIQRYVETVKAQQ